MENLVCECHRHRQSYEEVVEAGNKHKETLKATYAIAEEQKKKISNLRAENNALLEQIENLEFEAETDAKIIFKIKTENESWKTEISNYENEVEVKEIKLQEMDKKLEDSYKKSQFLKSKLEVVMRDHQKLQESTRAEIETLHNELTAATTIKSINNKEKEIVDGKKNEQDNIVDSLHKKVESLSRHAKDLEDEIVTKDDEIKKLSEIYEKKQESFLKSSSSSLSEELDQALLKNANLDLECKIEDLKSRIESFEKNKAEKKRLLIKIEELSKSRDNELKNLKESIESRIKPKENPNCRYGWNCRRFFCRFNHSYLFSKDNRMANHKKEKVDKKNELSNDEKNELVDVEKTSRVFKCNDCNKSITKKSCRKRHKKIQGVPE